MASSATGPCTKTFRVGGQESAANPIRTPVLAMSKAQRVRRKAQSAKRRDITLCAMQGDIDAIIVEIFKRGGRR